MTAPKFLSIPIKDLTVSLDDFQGRSEAYSSTTYNRIASEVKDGTFNFSALPAIMVWRDNRTDKWVILAGHSRTAVFSDLSKGKLPINPKYKPSDFAQIHAQVFEANSLENALDQARKVAQESNLSGQQSLIDFAFKVVKPMRESSKNMAEYWKKMDDLFGANKQAAHKLSYLNPNGKPVAMIKATKDLSDRQQRATVETIAEYIGRARERMPELTDSHENELYDWLTRTFAEEAKAKKEGRKLSAEISSEAKFLDHIASRVMRLGWSPEQPLNLDLVGSKSVYERTFDDTKLEKENQIRELQKIYNEKKQQLINANWPIEKIEEFLDPQEKYIIRLQKELAKYIQSYSQVEQATKNELSLFDSPSSPPPTAAKVEQYEAKLKALISVLRLTDKPMAHKKTTSTSTSDKKEKDADFQSQILRSNAGQYNFEALQKKEEYGLLISQLDYWLSEFEKREKEALKKYKPYIYDGIEYDPDYIRRKLGYRDVDMLKQICETAIHIFADHIIGKYSHKESAYEKLVWFYSIQPRIVWRSTKSINLQQYSTPVPIAYLMSLFCTRANSNASLHFLEPSAGTGLLTIGTPPKQWTVNEIDKDRLLCLEFLGFKKTYSEDALRPLPFDTDFDAILTNPPFQEHHPIEYDGYKIKRKEFIMAANALQHLKQNGRAAVIIGGLMKYDSMHNITPFYTDGVFFNYLYKHYNVVDVISINAEMYKQMGANWHIRVILIDGKRDIPSAHELPPTLTDIEKKLVTEQNSPITVKDYTTLMKRFWASI